MYRRLLRDCSWVNPAGGRALRRLNQQSRFLDWAGKEALFSGNPAALNHRFERVGGKLGEAIAV
jgi:hypothetical protein